MLGENHRANETYGEGRPPTAPEARAQHGAGSTAGRHDDGADRRTAGGRHHGRLRRSRRDGPHTPTAAPSRATGVAAFDRDQREELEDAQLAAARPVPGAPATEHGPRSPTVADLLRAGPRPDPARHRLPAAGRQDPGLRLPRGPPAHPAHPRPGGRPGGHQHRPGLPAERGAHRGHRPRPRLRARTGWPRQRGRPLALPRGGFDHAVWGADVSLAPLNLCAETLDGIRNHSWSRPAPSTPEGEVVSWADRIAYVCHDFEDAVASRDRHPGVLPDVVRGALRRAPEPAARHFHRRRGRRPWPEPGGSAWTRTGRRPGRLPGVQLRAHLPAPQLGGPGRGGDRGPAGPGRPLRRPPQPDPVRGRGRRGPPRRRAGGAAGRRRATWPG